MSEVIVELENIGVFRDRRKFKLNRGLNLIHAPNASGKTSLIAGLKAVTISALTPSELARTLNDYEERGRVKLAIDNNEYTVELIRRPDGTVEAWGKRLADNGVIKKIAFIDLENELVNAIYAGDEERVKQILREVSGVSYIETILSSIDGLKSEYEYRYESRRKEYESRREEVERQLSDIEKRLKSVRDRITEILRNPRIEPVRKEMEDIQRQRRELERELSKKRADEIAVNNTIAGYERDLRSLRAELEIRKERLSELNKEKEEIEKRIIEFRRKIEFLRKEIESLEAEETSLISELNEKKRILERRKQVLEYAQCPYCGAPIDKEKLEKEILALEDELYELRDKIDELRTEIERKEAEIDELRHSGEERLESIEREIDEVVKRIRELERRVSGIEQEINKAKQRLVKIEEDIKRIKDQLSILDKKLELLRREYPQIDILIEELRRLQSEEHHLEERRDYLRGRLMQLEQLYSEVISLGEMVETLELLSEYFRLRLSELKKIVVSNINEAILKHFKLLRLAELEYPIISEDFSLTLTRVGGTPTSLAELSDAEKAILTILVTIALKDYVAEEFPFYVVDTLIEFIDDTRARDIMMYLMKMAGKRKIVIVTKTKPYTGETRLLSQDDILINKIAV
ncbi:MAG: hypothetical protein DRJ52_09230 [Thermoprotei archaeon]|nr:MAG: hypothetical protein DRJ52_09230 [Thermoprotei archaeon]